MAQVVAFPLDRIVWPRIEAAITAEAEKNRHVGSARIWFGTSKALDCVASDLRHIPRDALAAEVNHLADRIREAVAVANEELRESVYRRPARETVRRLRK